VETEAGTKTRLEEHINNAAVVIKEKPIGAQQDDVSFRQNSPWNERNRGRWTG
jgi:hypothetical protein